MRKRRRRESGRREGEETRLRCTIQNEYLNYRRAGNYIHIYMYVYIYIYVCTYIAVCRCRRRPSRTIASMFCFWFCVWGVSDFVSGPSPGFVSGPSPGFCYWALAKSPQEVPRRPQEALMRPRTGPKRPKRGPKRPQSGPSFQTASTSSFSSSSVSFLPPPPPQLRASRNPELRGCLRRQ